jgi:hypothetical protein
MLARRCLTPQPFVPVRTLSYSSDILSRLEPVLDLGRCASALLRYRILSLHPSGSTTPGFRVGCRLDTLDVVHGLAIHEVAPKKVLGDENVLENVGTSSSAWMTKGSYHYVAGLVASTATPPVAVRFPGFAPTPGACDGLCLLRFATQAHISGSASGTSQMPARWGELPPTLPAGPHRHALTIGRSCDSQGRVTVRCPQPWKE